MSELASASIPSSTCPPRRKSLPVVTQIDQHDIRFEITPELLINGVPSPPKSPVRRSWGLSRSHIPQSPPPPKPPVPSPPKRDSTTLRVLVASWNVGNMMPSKSKDVINAWIPEGGGGYDVIAVGLQESSYKERSASEIERDRGRTVSPDQTPPTDDTETVIDNMEDDNHDETEDNTQEPDEQEEEEEEQESNEGEMKTIKKKKSRAKRSIRKVSKLMRQMSSNLRGSVAEALEYPFNRQLFLHLGDQYGIIGKVELMEMRLFIYVHNKHPVSQIEKTTVATGLGSVIGNKGGLLFKCTIRNTSLCFISCHLAAHQDQKFLDKRNADCASILHGSNLGIKHIQPDFQFDHCFWFGDLNYRVDLQYMIPKQPVRTHEQQFTDVMALVKAKKWTILNANDQLRHQLELKKTLMDWELPPALFPPTFKRVRYFPDQYNPQRIPSYCDRVLYKSLPGLKPNLKIKKFTSVDTIMTSDHKPVMASFHIQSTPRMTPPLGDINPSIRNITTIEFRDLNARHLLGMDMSGLSDPYIKFYTLPDQYLQRDTNGSHPSTAALSNTISPTWMDDQVPKLTILSDVESDIKRLHLVLLFMDYDTTSMDDVLGVVTLSLDKYCNAHVKTPRFIPFVAPIVYQGKPAGTVSGKLQVLLPHQQSGDINYPSTTPSRQNAFTSVGCHCTIT